MGLKESCPQYFFNISDALSRVIYFRFVWLIFCSKCAPEFFRTDKFINISSENLSNRKNILFLHRLEKITIEKFRNLCKLTDSNTLTLAKLEMELI